jgi:L-fuconolactonase
MRIIDSHAHIWIHDQEYPWATEESDIPQYDARLDALIEVMKGDGVDQVVLVQYIKYRWDNRYVAQVMKRYPSLFMGVCRVDPEDPNNPDQLSYWTEEHGFQGVRLSPEPDPRGDWFTGPLMVPLFKRAATLKIPVILLIKPERLNDLEQILEQVPEVNVVIDHLADCLNHIHLSKLLMLARYPGVFLKLGHISYHSTEGFPWCDTHSSLEKIFSNFGAERIMWGSDWPFCLSQMTYAQSLAYILESVKFLTPAEREWVVCKTALQIWH